MESVEQKFSRRGFLASLTLGVAGTVLASCASAPAPTATSPAPTSAPAAQSQPAAKPTTAEPAKPAATIAPTAAAQPAASTSAPTKVIFWNWLDKPDAPDFPNLIKQFEAEHPNIKIDWELGAFAQQHDHMVSAFAGGAGPDAFEMGSDWVGEFAGMGAISPIDDYYDKWKLKDDIYPRVIEQFRFKKGTPGGVGALYGLPFLLVAHYLYFRKDWAKEVGFKGSHPSGGPATADEFLQLAKAVTDPKKPRYGFAMRGSKGGESMWMESGGSYGIDLWQWTDKEKGEWKFTLDSEKSIAGSTWYVELVTKHKVCPPSAPADSFAEIVGNMKSGLTCMTFHHTQTVKDFSQAIGAENLGVVPVPRGMDVKDWKTYGGASGNTVGAKSKVRDAGWEFVSFIASPTFQNAWIKGQGGVPFNPSLATDPAIAGDTFVKTTLEGAPSWFVFPATPGLGEFGSSVFPTKMAEALTGKISPEQMNKAFNDHLNKTKG